MEVWQRKVENALSGISPNGIVFVDLRTLACITRFFFCFFLAFLPTEAVWMLVDIQLMFRYSIKNTCLGSFLINNY